MVELVEEELGVRVVADRDEQPVGIELPVSSVSVERSRTPHLAVAEHLVDDRVRDELDLLVGPRAVEHDLRGAELVAPVDDRDLDRERVRKIASSIAESPPPTTTMSLLAEEGAVAGRAVVTPRPCSALLGREPELAGARAGRDDDRLGAVLVVPDPVAERPLGEVDAASRRR